MITMGERNRIKRNERKKKLVSLKGGQCRLCGYKKSYSALTFHHRDEKIKLFNVSGKNLSALDWKILLAEIKKCDLLCANCHAETHDAEGWVHENGKKTPKH